MSDKRITERLLVTWRNNCSLYRPDDAGGWDEKPLGKKGEKTHKQKRGHESYSIDVYQFTPGPTSLRHRPTDESILFPHGMANILRLFCKNSDSIISTQNMYLPLCLMTLILNARSLQVLITRLRRSLSKAPGIRIIIVREIGYK